MTGAGWERLRKAMEQLLFLQRKKLWTELQYAAARRMSIDTKLEVRALTNKAEVHEFLPSWPGCLLLITDADVDAAIQRVVEPRNTVKL